MLNPQSNLRDERMGDIAKMFLLATMNFSEVDILLKEAKTKKLICQSWT